MKKNDGGEEREFGPDPLLGAQQVSCVIALQHMHHDEDSAGSRAEHHGYRSDGEVLPLGPIVA